MPLETISENITTLIDECINYTGKLDNIEADVWLQAILAASSKSISLSASIIEHYSIHLQKVFKGHIIPILNNILEFWESKLSTGGLIIIKLMTSEIISQIEFISYLILEADISWPAKRPMWALATKIIDLDKISHFEIVKFIFQASSVLANRITAQETDTYILFLNWILKICQR